MLLGCTSSVARPRKCSVPRIPSVPTPSLSRSSLASNSRPVASGTWNDSVGAADLLGALCVVALAPARVGILLDQLAQLEDAVHQSLGARGAAGYVHVDRHELVRGHERVVVEHAHRAAASAH